MGLEAGIRMAGVSRVRYPDETQIIAPDGFGVRSAHLLCGIEVRLKRNAVDFLADIRKVYIRKDAISTFRVLDPTTQLTRMRLQPGSRLVLTNEGETVETYYFERIIIEWPEAE